MTDTANTTPPNPDRPEATVKVADVKALLATAYPRTPRIRIDRLVNDLRATGTIDPVKDTRPGSAHAHYVTETDAATVREHAQQAFGPPAPPSTPPTPQEPAGATEGTPPPAPTTEATPPAPPAQPKPARTPSATPKADAGKVKTVRDLADTPGPTATAKAPAGQPEGKKQEKTEKPETKGKMGKAGVIILAVGVLVVAGVAVAYFVKKRKAAQQPTPTKPQPAPRVAQPARTPDAQRLHVDLSQYPRELQEAFRRYYPDIDAGGA